MKQTLWCCVGFQFEKPYYFFPSLAETRKRSIEKLPIGSWEIRKKHGWKCIKVEVIIKPINEVI